MENNNRTRGTVQWFSRVKGYGFIRPDDQEEDVFVHYSSIQGEGYRNLNEGGRVEFTIEDTPKGPQAIEVFEISQEETGVDVAMGDTEEAEDTIEDVFESDMEEVEDTIEDVFELDMEEIEPAETFL